jgi:uncharacterized protein
MEEYSLGTYLLATAAALAAGAINSIAGGGTVLTFPALLTALPPVYANATSTVSLLPGSTAGAWGFRREVHSVRKQLVYLIPPSIFGGVLGAYLVVLFPAKFDRIFPWLMLTATLLFLLQQPLQRRFGTPQSPEHARPFLPFIIACQFLIAFYGGYFGAGIGILMLSTLGFMGFADIHRVNGAKTVLSSIINAVSVVIFVADGLVVWALAIPMGMAAVVGGYAGARLARRLSKETVRRVVIAIGLSVTVYFFWKQLSG